VKKLKSSKGHQTFKDNWSEHWLAYAKSASDNPAQEMRHDMILTKLKMMKKPKLLLDIGSGQGDFLQAAVSEKIADKFVGFELSDTGVNIARSKVKEAEFMQVNLFSPPKNLIKFAEQADVVVCTEVIEHVDEPAEFCRLIKKYMKPGGELLLSVPGGPMSEFDQYIGHRTHYNQKSITKLLTSVGFEVDNVYLAGFPFFNIYRIMVILRGRNLISDVETSVNNSFSQIFASLMMRIFKILFKLNLNHSKFGWQVFAAARKPY
jgi:2-polyprenyl-3-methyl-5-hydroxy-6-metoxy-1,4-benzoquinol methylase